MNEINWVEIVNAIVDVALVPILTVLVGLLVTYIKKKSLALQEANKVDMLDKYISLAENLVCQCVMETNQIYADKMKEKGVFDEQAQKEAFEMTKTAFLEELDVTARDFLENALGDFEMWVETQIEASVVSVKE